jgi:hypothetical protein
VSAIAHEYGWRMRVAVGLVAAAAACVPAALLAAPAGEASFPRTSGKIAFASDRAAVAGTGTDPAAGTTARRDQVVVEDDGVLELFALDGMLLYGRVGQFLDDRALPATTRRWMRVANGRQLEARGIPAGSGPVSIGRDPTGRVVAVLGQGGSGDEPAQWWLYDVERDSARRLRVPAEEGCATESVAVWRGRMAYAARCPWFDYKWRVVVREGASTTRVTKRGWRVKTLVLRNQSLAVLVSGSRFEQTVWRVLDRGRRCPKPVGGTQDEYGIWAGLGSGTLTWAIADWMGDFGMFALSEVGDVNLSSRCQSAPRTRHTAPSLLPRTTIHGSYGASGPAIDGRRLYYATDTAIHMLRLPAHRAIATSRER